MNIDSLKPRKFSLLIAEDDASLREVLAYGAEEKGFTVTIAADGFEAVMKAKRQTFDAILVDMNLPKKKGYDVIDEVITSSMSRDALFFVLSGYLTKEVVTHVAGKIEKAFTKPADVDLVMDTIKNALMKCEQKKAG